jgi:hypothetical protein
MNWRNLVLFLALMGLSTAGCSSIPGSMGAAATPTGTVPAPIPTEFLWFPPTDTPAVAMALSPEPTPEQKPRVGELLVIDDMTSTAHWNAAASGQAAVTVSQRGLTVSAGPSQPPVVSLHRSAVFDNMYIEITARPSLCREKDVYGLVFRAPNEVAYYRYAAICDGTVAAERISLGGPRVLQVPTATSDVPVGAPGEVKLGVWALGSELRFFLNDRYQFTVEDSNYVVGGLGVFAEARGETPVVVTFSGLRVYRLDPVLSLATSNP